MTGTPAREVISRLTISIVKNETDHTPEVEFRDEHGRYIDPATKATLFANFLSAALEIVNATVTEDTHGNLLLGSGAVTANAATDGFLYVPVVAGTPTGTPRVITGGKPVIYDTTANKIWVNNGGTWRATAALT